MKLFQEMWMYICIFYYFQHWDGSGSWNLSFLVEDKEDFILCSRYHGCSWPGDTRTHVIVSHDDYLKRPVRVNHNLNNLQHLILYVLNFPEET